MRCTAVLTTVAVVSLGLIGSAAGGRPIYERLQLNAADMTRARHVAVRKGDLRPGWRQLPAGAFTRNSFNCPGVDLDFSMFTITGRARSKFQSGLATIESNVEVFKSRAHAASDFRKGSTPKMMGCVVKVMREEAAGQGMNLRIVSSGPLRRLRVAEQAIGYRIVTAMPTGNGTVRVFTDLVGFQRGRTAVALFFTGARAPVSGQLALARAVAARAR